MFSCFSPRNKCSNRAGIPLKVLNVDRQKRVGIVAKSLKDLESKLLMKLKIATFNEVRVVFEEDGTEIEDDEVLYEIPPQTTLMVLEAGQIWTPEVSTDHVEDVESALSALLSSNKRLKATEQFLDKIKDKKDPEMIELLGQIVKSMGQQIHAETREEDPDWFKDQPSSKRSKSSVMRECSKRRVRKYYNTAIDHVKSKYNSKIPPLYQEIFDNFLLELKVNDLYGDYFDRQSSQIKSRLCDEEGWFVCEGSYDVKQCPFYDHRINPYGSRANYVVFSTWNLDHRIEKSREILPKLIQAQSKKPRGKELNWLYFYDLLFTRMNLRLVHASCHDKTEHNSEKCNPKKFYC